MDSSGLACFCLNRCWRTSAARKLRYIFLHELAHVKRRDMAVHWLATVLQVLHWFNPILRFGFRRMAADRELACDELALSQTNAHETRSYGETIIKLLESFAQPAPLPGLMGIIEDKNEMAQRITMIAKFKRRSRWSALALVLIAAVGLITLTDAETKKADESIATNSLTLLTQIETNANTFTGKVFLPNGKPAEGAEIAVATESMGAVLGDRRLLNRNESIVTDTKADGSFSLPSANGAHTLFVIHNAGFAEVLLNEENPHFTITLKPWGRIEGTIEPNLRS